jgi:histone acetyltransferase (RNA polymerase elongator complex component)
MQAVLMIIPFFIPHLGCPHQCVFCNQKKITGETRQLDPASIPSTIESYLGTNGRRGPVQVAFYGGSFTALPDDVQKAYLEAVQPFIATGRIESIRLSTRPDCITDEILAVLKHYQVKTVELGAQSMDDRVLQLSGRGHRTADTKQAVNLLREHHFGIGLQLMPGLPGDSADTFKDTVAGTIALKPHFVRLYPALVIQGTPLEELYSNGRYAPLSLEEAVSWCKEALIRFEEAGIEVIRVGLQPTEELEKPGVIIAGPYHPAFRQLVESALYLDKMRTILKQEGRQAVSVAFSVHPSAVSSAIGQKRSNICILQEEFGLSGVRIISSQEVPRGEVRYRSLVLRNGSRTQMNADKIR